MAISKAFLNRGTNRFAVPYFDKFPNEVICTNFLYSFQKSDFAFRISYFQSYVDANLKHFNQKLFLDGINYHQSK